MDRTIKCSILIPEKTLYEGEVNFAVVQAHDGEMGFLYNHSPLISELGVGEVRFSDKDSTHHVIVEGGIVQMRENNLIVLAENAYNKDEMDPKELSERISKLRNEKMQSEDFEPFFKEVMVIKSKVDKVAAELKTSIDKNF